MENQTTTTPNKDPHVTTEFNEETYRLLRKAYEEAEAGQKDTFEFAGGQFVTKFAKYLLEYYESKHNIVVKNN